MSHGVSLDKFGGGIVFLFGIQMMVTKIAAKDLNHAKRYFKKKQIKGKITHQESDVLDTWFSSALWPFSTLNWPQKNKILSKYYPSDVLVTGFDIIFFWVARMIMMGLFFMKKIPFKIYIFILLLRMKKVKKCQNLEVM